MSVRQTKWCVITGGPNAGKSKVIERLAYFGYSIRPEISRIHIDNELSKGRLLAEIRGNEGAFQNRLVEMKLGVQAKSQSDTILFWDRGLPDSIAYMNLAGLETSEVERHSQNYRYNHVFLMDLLPHYQIDYARNESIERAKRIHADLDHCYQSLGYNLHRIPVMSIEDRVQKILEIVGEV